MSDDNNLRKNMNTRHDDVEKRANFGIKSKVPDNVKNKPSINDPKKKD